MSKSSEARTWASLPGVQVCEGAGERRGQGTCWGDPGTEEEMGDLQQGFEQSKDCLWLARFLCCPRARARYGDVSRQTKVPVCSEFFLLTSSDTVNFKTFVCKNPPLHIFKIYFPVDRVGQFFL